MRLFRHILYTYNLLVDSLNQFEELGLDRTSPEASRDVHNSQRDGSSQENNMNLTNERNQVPGDVFEVGDVNPTSHAIAFGSQMWQWKSPPVRS